MNTTEKINHGYVFGKALTSSIGFFLMGYTYAYFNIFTDIMHPKYQDSGKYVIENKDMFNSIVSGCIPGGAAIGALVFGPIATKGKRSALILVSSLFTVGILLTLVFDVWFLIFGRLLVGMCVGGYSAVSPSFVSEISPVSLSGILGVLNQFNAACGVFVAASLAYMMPYPSDPESRTSGMWRIIFGLPMLFSLAQVFLFSFVYVYDTPKHYETHGDEENYHQIMGKIYASHDPRTQPLVGKNDAENGGNTQAKHHHHTFSDLFAAKYKMAFLVSLSLSILQQFTAVNGVIFNSNTIFTNGKNGIDADKAARLGSFFIGVSGFVGTSISLYTGQKLGRKQLFILGEVVMGFFLSVIAA